MNVNSKSVLLLKLKSQIFQISDSLSNVFICIQNKEDYSFHSTDKNLRHLLNAKGN